MGRLRKKSSTTKEGSQQSKGQTAIDQFFSKGPSQRGGLFTQVGLPAKKGPGSSKGTATSGRTAASRARPNQRPCCSTSAVPAAQSGPCCSVTVVPETQLTSPAPAQKTSEHCGARSEVIGIPDTQAAGTQFIAEFSDDSSDFVTATPKHKVGRKTKTATLRGRSAKLSLRGRGASKENVAKHLGRTAGKRGNNVLEDVSSKSPDNVPGEEGACSSDELNKSLVISPEGREWINKQVNNDSFAGQNCARGSHDNHSAESKHGHEPSTKDRTTEQDSPIKEEEHGADAVTMATLVQIDSPEIIPEARVKQNARSLATRTKQNRCIATNSLDSKVIVSGGKSENCEETKRTENVSEAEDGGALSDEDTSGSLQDRNRTSTGGKKWLSWTGSLLGKRSPARGSSPVGKRSRTPDTAAGTQLRRGTGVTCRKNLSTQLDGQDVAQGQQLAQGQQTSQGQGQQTQVKGEQDEVKGEQDKIKGEPTQVKVEEHPASGDPSDRTDPDSRGVVRKAGRTEVETTETDTIDTGGSTVKCHNAGNNFTSILPPVKSTQMHNTGLP
ncbi:uncharacterized protein LOC118411893 [Branchiostoma floridae]|uniref:Uncharacterized protein LOC118411893 n=1 Tax=Branchiostoma floridae TaxID=7739 RepID=A0A9J7KTZ8_BRAFL|nr:uncharacterized protein LOC118411893 [Branchiostoma floridae]